MKSDKKTCARSKFKICISEVTAHRCCCAKLQHSPTQTEMIDIIRNSVFVEFKLY